MDQIKTRSRIHYTLLPSFLALFLFFGTGFLLPGLIAQSQDWASALDQSLTDQQSIAPVEKAYLHTDRTLYQPGETIWLAGYLIGSEHALEGAISALLRVDLIHPSGSVLTTLELAQQGGCFTGDITLQPSWPGGLYRLRAYTNYQGNFGDDWVFEKEITVQKAQLPSFLFDFEFEREAYGPGDQVKAFVEVKDALNAPLVNHSLTFELQVGGRTLTNGTTPTNLAGMATVSVDLPADLASSDALLLVKVEQDGRKGQLSRRPPIVLDKISLQFFPEGGDWVAGLPTQMAYLARDEWGEPADVQGMIVDADGNEVASFTSYHDGMGVVELPEEVKWPLTARLVKPTASSRKYPLPNPIRGQWQLTARYDQEDCLEIQVHSLVKEELHLAVRNGEQLLGTHALRVEAGVQSFSIPVANLPMGITQLTVFDQAMRPSWERLVFLHPQRKVNVSLETDQEQYLPREAVEVCIRIWDEEGLPLAGQFSLSVVDEQLLTYADDKQAHLPTHFLLTSELRGEIHEPNFYFDQEEDKATAALDLLMLTHGWRRFHWRQLLAYSPEQWTALRQFPPENLSYVGNVYLDGSPVARAEVLVNGLNEPIPTDEQGRFWVSGTDIAPNEIATVRYRGLRTKAGLRNLQVNRVGQPFKPGQEKPEYQLVDRQNVKELAFDEIVVVAKDEEVVSGEMALEDWEGPESKMLLDEVVITGYGLRADQMSSALVSTVSEVRVVELEEVNLDLDMDDRIPELSMVPQRVPRARFYQARVFAMPDYNNKHIRENGATDLRSTLYWNPQVMIDARGKGCFQFFSADKMSTYRIVLEGVAGLAELVHREAQFTVAPALAIEANLPTFASTNDTLLVPVFITNTTQKAVKGELEPLPEIDGLRLLSSAWPSTIQLKGQEVRQYVLAYEVLSGVEEVTLPFAAKGKRWNTEVAYPLTICPKGFPTHSSISGNQSEAAYELTIENVVPSSIEASIQLYGDLSGELLAGVAGLLAEPNGCFEQTSSTNYPNIMVLDYLQQQNRLDETTRQRAWGFLERGYQRLAGYEVPGGGFSLFGRAPANQLITAYGLMQFHDLQEVWPKVDPELLQRAQKWLTQAFEKRSFQGTIDDAYLLYALTDNGQLQWQDRLQILNHKAQEGKEPYVMVLASHLNHRFGNNDRAHALLDELWQQFEATQFAGLRGSPSLSHSMGQSVPVELVGWMVLAAIDQQRPHFDIKPLVDFLMANRLGAGRFGATPATVMALKAISAFEAYSARPKGAGEMVLSINGLEVGTLAYNEQSAAQLQLQELGQYFHEGENHISLSYGNSTHPLPYAMEVRWQTYQPPTHPDAPLGLHVELSQSQARVGDAVRYTVRVGNAQEEEGYAPMVLVSAPAGLNWQAWQLKEMQEQLQFDYYEIHDQYLVLYFERLKIGEVRSLHFDLLAESPGTFRAPAATAYLYYYDEAKTWIAGPQIEILP